MKTSKLFLVSFLMLAGCAKVDFTPAEILPELVVESQDYSRDEFFEYKAAEDYFEQDQYEKNVTTFHFQVTDGKGKSVNGLTQNDIEVLEGNQSLGQFQLTGQSVNMGQKADIVFVIDITNSMEPTINSVKTRVRNFVEQMKAKKVQALLCLVTFKDHTQKKCDNIIEDNPATPQNENLDAFLDAVANLDVSGGGDSDENQLRALIDAAAAPWRPGAQRMAILMTDAGFHYKPDNKGAAKEDAPFYTEAMTALQDAQMTLFAVTPKEDGYNRPFDGHPSLVDLTQGLYFNYKDIVNGHAGMETVFNAIIDRVMTDYTVEFSLEDNGLDGSSPLGQRRVHVKVKGHPEYKLFSKGLTSNWPQGHPEYKKKWKLSKKPREGEHRNLKVFVNGQLQASGYRLEKEELHFERSPAAGAKVQIMYDPASIRDGVSVKSLILPENLDVSALQVFYNSVEVGFDQMKLSRDTDGRYILDPSFTVFSSEDPYRIVDRGGLVVTVAGKVNVIVQRPTP